MNTDIKNLTGQKLYQYAKSIIPGGTQLLSKRPELYLPDQWPSYYKRARGCEVWDLDENHYIDFTTVGIGTSVFGYADPDVEAAVIEAIRAGNMCTLNCPEEVSLGELLFEIHPWADMVRYARSGGEIAAVAIRIARAATERDNIAVCGYHGWHDWYLSINIHKSDKLKDHLLPGLEPKGVSKKLGGTTHAFRYNQIEELEKIIQEHGQNLGAVIMEPIRDQGPKEGFLERVRELCSKNGIVLIFDEITSGFRLGPGGAHMNFEVKPDLAVFGKALSSGFPMAAVIGRKEVMEAAQDSFISSTYWTDRIGPAASIATLRKFSELKGWERLNQVGTLIQNGWMNAAASAGLEISVEGIPPLAHFGFKHALKQELVTLFIQEMLDRGYLTASSVYATLAHTDEKISTYLENVGQVFEKLSDCLKCGDVARHLRGPIKHSGFARLN